MPKSKQRQKQKAKRRPYAPPPPKKRVKSSPRWYAPVVLGLIFLGVVMLVLNYMGLMPGTQGTAAREYLWGGLFLIALGFMGTTRLR